MSATALTPARDSVLQLSRPRTLVVRALVLSRLIVLGAGVLASLATTRLPGWRGFDPAGFSVGLGRVGNVLSAASVRWDSIHYLQIARFGYRTLTDAPFFPLYPLLLHVGGWLTGSDALAGILISLTAFLIALELLHRLTELELGARAADATVLLLALAPLSLFFSAVYTESLFLALSVGAFYAARTGRWTVAVALAGLAAVTRIPGVLLIVPLGIMLLRSPARSWGRVASLLLIPATLGVFLAYLASRGFGWLGPVTGEESFEFMHVMSGPFATLGYGTGAAFEGIRSLLAGGPIYQPTLGGPFSLDFQSIVLLAVVLLALFALLGAFRRLPLAASGYALAVLAVCLYSPNLVQPLEGLDRYMLVIFPLWMAAGRLLSRHRRTLLLVLAASAALSGFYAFEFARWAFIA